MQVCTAGNLRTTLLCAEAARRHDAFDRFLIATDTPTGSGVMPLGMIYTMVNIASLAGFDPTWTIAAATGNVAEVYGLNSGFLRPGRDADVVDRRCPARRHQGERARDHEQRRSGRHRRRHQRRDSPLRRPQPQHPADHAEGRRRPLHGAGRLRDVSRAAYLRASMVSTWSPAA